MQLRVVTGRPWEVKADVLVVPIVGRPRFEGPLDELDRRSGGELRGLATFGELKEKRYSTTLGAAGEVPVTRLLTVGAGDAATLDRESIVRLAAAAIRRLGGRKAKHLAIWIDPLVAHVDGGATTVAELVTRGIVEGAYDPRTIYRESVESAPPVLSKLTIVAADPGATKTQLAHAAERGQIIGEGANLTRTLANRSANDVSPAVLADEARAIAEQHGLWIDVIEPERARELGMGMFLAVGQGSSNPPRMIVLRSGAEGERDALDRHLAIVGKGVCFDTGGISIKPSDRMEEMKMDKTGACTVIAAMATVSRLAPGTPLLAVAPAVENMPGPHSTRPGDLVRALNGKWVDITNTDAEGRLILGDAMTWAERLGATHIVDVATLTGAVGRALGHLITGAFGRPQSFYDEVIGAATRAGERYWQLPLVDDYVPDMASWYGDLQNSGTAEGSLVKSALFLREFVTKPWVHLDIAGTAYYRKTLPFAARGATGVSHATLVELALAGAR
ncbi:MAG TPA: leucyl aminopeptidase [Candidatus Limnocylindrales bacterium]|nr:leucyl aminopeptidase [Candidatus Limnocylindrales bacterium]